MPTWSEIAAEISAAQASGDKTPFDTVRRRYLSEISKHTGRDTILYASRFMQPGGYIPDVESIVDEDLQALMEVVHGLGSPNLDLIVHSPGGSAEATESIVSFLRRRYKHIRFIVPQLAMSAATMWACSANQIVMGPQSSLGPIDPQMRVMAEGGVGSMIPAQAILDQFAMARQECSRPGGLNAWLPILRQYGPALLVQCDDAINLSQELVKDWLKRYMITRRTYASRDALRISRGLSDHNAFKSHARHLDRDRARSIGGGHVGLNVLDLEKDARLDELVMSVFYATMHVFTAAPQVAKIVENHKGRAFVKIAGAIPIARIGPPPAQGAPHPPPPPPPAAP